MYVLLKQIKLEKIMKISTVTQLNSTQKTSFEGCKVQNVPQELSSHLRKYSLRHILKFFEDKASEKLNENLSQVLIKYLGEDEAKDVFLNEKEYSALCELINNYKCFKQSEPIKHKMALALEKGVNNRFTKLVYKIITQADRLKLASFNAINASLLLAEKNMANSEALIAQITKQQQEQVLNIIKITSSIIKPN